MQSNSKIVDPHFEFFFFTTSWTSYPEFLEKTSHTLPAPGFSIREHFMVVNDNRYQYVDVNDEVNEIGFQGVLKL